MSFFDDASLAFLPSGAAGKDGKAYSIKPTDGTGDFTFSRGSNLAATRVGADGLIEKGRENLVLQSNQFDTTWSSLNSPTLTSGQEDKDGGTNAWKFSATSSGSDRAIYQNTTGLNIVVTSSFYAKKGSVDFIYLASTRASSSQAQWFDLANGTLGTKLGSDIIASNIESVGNGWYRCSVTSAPYTTGYSFIALVDGDNSQTSSNGDFVYIQSAQLEIGLAATDVISTGATTGKAGLLEDEPRFDYSGGATCPSLLLEPSRTNLVQYSEAFSQWNSNLGSPVVTDNFATSPEGFQNATKITFPSTSDAVTDVYGGVTAGTDLVFSIYVKNIDASFTEIRVRNSITDFESRVNWTGSQITSVTTINGTLEYEAVGNDWYRIWGAYTNDDTSQRPRLYSNGANNSYLVWGAQLEAGSYPTSYIPNHSGGSVTRGADLGSSSYTGITSTSGTLFFDLKEGFQGDGINSGVASLGLRLASTGTSNSIGLRDASTGRLQGVVRVGASSTTLGNLLTGDADTKICIVWTSSTAKIFENGSLVESVSISTPSVFDTFELPNTTRAVKAPLKQVLTFPTALTDAECIALTTL